MFQNKQVVEVEDRRSPPLFVRKKVCFDSLQSDSNVVTVTESRVEIQKKKSVTFNDASLEERIEFEDDKESMDSRKLYWEFFAADRYRFKDRIERLHNVLSPVLAATHRSEVYSYRISKSPSTCSLSPLEQNEEVKMVVVKKKSEIPSSTSTML